MLSKSSKIGFIGLGKMGGSIARRIIEKNFQLMVYDCIKETRDSFAPAAKVAETPEEILMFADVILLSLPGSPEVNELLEKFIKQGVKEKYIVDLSTSYPGSSADIYSRIKEAGGYFVDAPLTGNPKGALKGELNTIVGGDIEVYEALSPIFDAFTSKTFYAGKAGTGDLIKLATNYLACMYIPLYAEIIPLVEKMGGDYQVMYEVISNSVANCGMFQRIAPKIHEDNYEVSFLLKHGIKDLSYIRKIFDDNGFPSIVLDSGLSLFKMAKCQGLEDKDISEVARVTKRFLGFEQ